jgi:hypothetical protein
MGPSIHIMQYRIFVVDHWMCENLYFHFACLHVHIEFASIL